MSFGLYFPGAISILTRKKGLSDETSCHLSGYPRRNHLFPNQG